VRSRGGFRDLGLAQQSANIKGGRARDHLKRRGHMRRSFFKTHPQCPVVPSVAFQFGDWKSPVFRP
jgi:hypothetical protein